MPNHENGSTLNGRATFLQIASTSATTTIIGACAVWFGTTNRIDKLETWRNEDKVRSEAVAAETKAKIDASAADQVARLKYLAEVVERINREGTQASQKGIYQESDFSHSTERRVQALEKAVADFNTQLSGINAGVARCDERLQWLTRDRTLPTGIRPERTR